MDMYLTTVVSLTPSNPYSDCYSCGGDVRENINFETLSFVGKNSSQEFADFLVNLFDSPEGKSISVISVNGFPVLVGDGDYEELELYISGDAKSYPVRVDKYGNPALPTKRDKNYGLMMYGPFYENGMGEQFKISLDKLHAVLFTVKTKLAELREEKRLAEEERKRQIKLENNRANRERRARDKAYEQSQLAKLLKKHPEMAKEFLANNGPKKD
jgi:hypothetical protein